MIGTAELVKATRRVQLVLEREAALRYSFTAEGLTLEAAGSEQAQASEQLDAVLAGDDIVVSLKPQFLLDGPRVSTRSSCESRSRRRRTRTSPVRCSSPGRSRAEDEAATRSSATSSSRTCCCARPDDEDERHSMKIGLVGLGKMGNNMRARLKKGGIDVVGYDTNPDVSDVPDYAALAAALPDAARGLGHGAGREDHRLGHRRAGARCSSRAT